MTSVNLVVGDFMVPVLVLLVFFIHFIVLGVVQLADIVLSQ